MTDARAPEQSNRESSAPHHDLPRDAARPVQRTRIRDAMSAVRMGPVVNDPWANPGDIGSGGWGARRTAERTESPLVDLTDTPGSVEDPATGEVEAVVDLRRSEPPAGDTSLPARAHYGLGDRWGSRWAISTQGWVRAADGTVIWRPIVTTTEHLDLWEVDRYLGVVTAEVAAVVEGTDNTQLGSVLARAREIGLEGLIGESVERGAHAVIGVDIGYTTVGPRLIVTMTGTAVTLREKRA